MIVKAFCENDKWYAEIWNGDQCVQYATNPERRVGCAIRNAMNRWELMNGKPSFTNIEVNINDW